MKRPALAALVATLLLVGGGVATAAWRTTNTGTATAKAGSIGTPTGVTIGTVTCTTSGSPNTATVPVSWNAVSGAAQYTVELTRTFGLGQAETKTVTGTSTTFTTTNQLLGLNVKVTAKAGNWVGTPSATVSKAATCAR